MLEHFSYIPFDVAPCFAAGGMLYCQCSVMFSCVELCCVMLCCVVLHRVVLCCAVLCSVV